MDAPLIWIWPAQLRFTQIAQEATRQDYLHEVEHMRERVARLEQAIMEAVKLASPVPQQVINDLQGVARYRRYLGCDHCGRAGPSIPLRQCSAADGVLRRGAQRRLQSGKANQTRRHH